MLTTKRASAAIAVTGLTLAALSGCGFVAAGNKSAVKPSTFVLSGHASVTLPAGDTDAVGTPCVAPTGATDVAKNVDVIVTNATGTKIATGHLGDGVVTHGATASACTFPFQIRGVPGTSDSYGVAIGNRPSQTFSGDALRTSTPAVITITPATG